MIEPYGRMNGGMSLLQRIIMIFPAAAVHRVSLGGREEFLFLEKPENHRAV
jgi:hypothetical protein